MSWPDAIRFVCWLAFFGALDILFFTILGWAMTPSGDLIMAAMFTIVAAIREQQA